MSYEEFHHLADGMSGVATVLAVVGGGIWAWRKLIVQRENVPHIQFNVGVEFIGIRGDAWLCAVTATIKNAGVVRHVIRQFTFSLRTLDRTDALTTDSSLSGQVVFPHKIATGSWLPRDREYTFIEPKVESNYSYITMIPRAAEFVLVHGRFSFRQQKEFQTADEVARVPAFEMDA